MKGFRSDVAGEIKTLAGFLRGVVGPPEEVFGLIQNPSLWLSKNWKRKIDKTVLADSSHSAGWARRSRPSCFLTHSLWNSRIHPRFAMELKRPDAIRCDTIAPSENSVNRPALG
jgi:hypothetical protein